MRFVLLDESLRCEGRYDAFSRCLDMEMLPALLSFCVENPMVCMDIFFLTFLHLNLLVCLDRDFVLKWWVDHSQMMDLCQFFRYPLGKWSNNDIMCVVYLHLFAKYGTIYIMAMGIWPIYPGYIYIRLYMDGFVQERHDSSALAMELHLSCTNPPVHKTGICITQKNQCLNPCLLS